MKYRIAALAAFGAALLMLAGCATKPQAPVGFDAKSLAMSRQTVGVAMTAVPKPEVQLPGAGCLLCILTAQVANSALSKHAETLTTDDLSRLRQRIADALAKRGATVKVIAEPVNVEALPQAATDAPGFARKNFSALKQKYGVDKLLVIEIHQLGFERTYTAYIPTSDPKALFRGVGYIVDLRTNKLEWYQPVDVRKSADGQWDEPARFPGLTNAYFQALEIGQDTLVRPLSN
jgi:hypothetical protein